MAIYDEWKKEMEKRFAASHGPLDKIPSIVARCPKCHHLTISYDIDSGKLKCTNCGFEESMPMIKGDVGMKIGSSKNTSANISRKR